MYFIDIICTFASIELENIYQTMYSIVGISEHNLSAFLNRRTTADRRKGSTARTLGQSAKTLHVERKRLKTCMTPRYRRGMIPQKLERQSRSPPHRSPERYYYYHLAVYKHTGTHSCCDIENFHSSVFSYHKAVWSTYRVLCFIYIQWWVLIIITTTTRRRRLPVSDWSTHMHTDVLPKQQLVYTHNTTTTTSIVLQLDMEPRAVVRLLELIFTSLRTNRFSLLLLYYYYDYTRFFSIFPDDTYI